MGKRESSEIPCRLPSVRLHINGKRRKLLLSSRSAIPPVRPDEPTHRGHDQHSDHGVELMKIFAEGAPVLTELHPCPGKNETPGPRSEKRVGVKLSARHPGNAGGQRDKRAHHRQQPGDEHRRVTPARKEAIGPIEFATPHQYPPAVALDQRTSTVMADLVSHQRSKIAPDSACGRDPKQAHAAFVNQVASERHDQFRRKRNAGRLNRHQDGDSGVAGRRDRGFDEDEQDSEDFLGHAIRDMGGISAGSGSKRPFLSKAEARQGYALPRLGYFYLYHGSIGRGHFRRTQHRELAEHFAINFCDEVILAARILPPNLPEFDALHSHEFFPSTPRLLTGLTPSQLQLSYVGTGCRACWHDEDCLLP